MIELDGSELRVVSSIDGFVTELFTNFIDTLDTTNNKILKVKFGSYSHEDIQIQIVVMSLERTSCCTSWDHIHHRSLNFKVTTVVEELTDVSDDARTSNEDLSS